MTIAELRTALDAQAPPRARRQLESALQTACVRWFRLVYPEYALRLFAIPNGGQRGKITAAILKGEGVLAGVPDLFLAVGTPARHGLFIEMKISPNKPSPTQKGVLADYAAGNYATKVVYSFAEFRNVVATYLTY